MTHYCLNLWVSQKPHQPVVVGVPYRGGPWAGFNDLFIYQNYLFVADDRGILCSPVDNRLSEYFELEPLQLHDKQILSMKKTSDDYLQLLTNHGGKSLLELVNPLTREIKESRELKRKYDLGDRLHQVEDQLVIVRHLEDEIVDAETEDYIKLSGAENNVPIPEISSTWEYPQYLYVASALVGTNTIEKEK